MARRATPAADYESYTVRLPKEMLAALRHQAHDIGRPLNLHLIWTLNSGLHHPESVAPPKEDYAHAR
jgi:hypothetical protein